MEVSEIYRSKRQLLDLMEKKDEEIGEKNSTIQSNFDKIVSKYTFFFIFYLYISML